MTEKLDIIPARIQVIRHIRPKYACKNCEGVDGDGDGHTVKIAPPPVQFIPNLNSRQNYDDEQYIYLK